MNPIEALTAPELAPLFWRPSRLGADSAWFGHVPFAHWIVGQHRPRSIVELGAHNGVSYAAFCEAVLREGVDASALAVDTWRGDEHAGFYGDDVYADLVKFHDQHYAAFSTMLRATFDEALGFVLDGSVDLLHIDGRHRYEDVSHDFSTWVPKLSPRAIVLFHDTNVRQGDFGVWRLWAELREAHPSFEFLHGHGLGVLACGPEVQGSVAELCALRDPQAIAALRDRFGLIGERWIATRNMRTQMRVQEQLVASLGSTQQELTATRSWAEKAQAEVNKLFPMWQSLTETHRTVRANLARARYDVSARERELAERDAAAASGLTALQAERAAGVAELAASKAELAATRAELHHTRSSAAQTEAALAGAQAHATALEETLAAILSSTSWRLTAPLRRLLGAPSARLSTNPASPQFAPSIRRPVPSDVPAAGQSVALAGPVDASLPAVPATATDTPAPVAIAPGPATYTPAPTVVIASASATSKLPPIVTTAPATADPTPAPATSAASETHTASTAPAGAPNRHLLFISGEDHTPGTTYRVDRYVAVARALGLDARASVAGPVGPAELAGARLVVLWRVPYSTHIAGIIQVAHEQGATVVFDVDDLMFRPELATIEVIDGIRSQRFSEQDTQEFFRLIGRTLRACDLVTCPTEELAHQVRQTGRPATVLPNGFDAASHASARRAHRDWLTYADDLVRIGYAGGSRTHQRDFTRASAAIARVLRAYPQTRLTLFRDPSSGEGLVLVDEFPELADLADRIEWRDMVPLAELPGEIARFAINIAPLEVGNPFCEAKSELKFFEAALAGVPTVASPTGPFRRAIDHGTNGLLADAEDEWFAALVRLVENPAERTRLAQGAYHTSLARFGPEARTEAFALMLAQVEGGPDGAAAFERDRYRAGLPPSTAPYVPTSTTLFARDMMADAAVTVIVPVFNYADYVTEALQSVADQTLQRLDLVVVDDASPDDSGQMVLDWVRTNEQRFNRIRVLRHAQNAGLGFARNSGFAAAETPFVLPLDADNRLRPTACESLLRALSGTRAAFAYPAIQQFGTASEVFGDQPYSVLRLQPGNYIDAMALVRKSAWAAAGGFDHVQHGWEDFDFWCRLAERGFHGVSVPDVLADYRVHGGSMLHTTTEKRENREALAADMQRRHPWLDLCASVSLRVDAHRNVLK